MPRRARILIVAALLACDASACRDSADIREPETDAATADSAPVRDMAIPDLTEPPRSDMLSSIYSDPTTPDEPAVGCRSGRGYNLHGWAAACPAKWTLQPGGGQFQKVCADGWAPCDRLPIRAELCASLRVGFFAAISHGWQKNSLPQDATMTCSWGGDEPNAPPAARALFGCGAERDTQGAPAVQCGGFPVLIPCIETPQGGVAWTCQHLQPTWSDADMAYITAPGSGPSYRSGALCCKF